MQLKFYNSNPVDLFSFLSGTPSSATLNNPANYGSDSGSCDGVTPDLIAVGIAGYVSGTVAWNISWAPTTSDPSVPYRLVGAMCLLVGVDQSTPSVGPLSFGILTVQATVDGIPVDGSMQIAFADDLAEIYQTKTWGEGGGLFWTQYVNSYEVP